MFLRVEADVPSSIKVGRWYTRTTSRALAVLAPSSWYFHVGTRFILSSRLGAASSTSPSLILVKTVPSLPSFGSTP